MQAYNIPQKKTPEQVVNSFLKKKAQYHEAVKKIDDRADLYDNKKKQLKYEGWKELEKERNHAQQQVKKVRENRIRDKETDTFQTYLTGFSDSASEFFDMKPEQLADRMKYYQRIGDKKKYRAAAHRAYIDGHKEIVKDFISSADSDTQKNYQELNNLKAEYANSDKNLEVQMQMSMPPKP